MIEKEKWGCEITASTETVSYTHLDVYKRQPYRTACSSDENPSNISLVSKKVNGLILN